MTTPETPTTSAEPQVRVRARRRGGTPLDMVRSLALVGLAVLGMVAFTFFGQPEHPPVTVDVQATVQYARADSSLPVLAMTAVPQGWYANTARYARDASPTFHVGYVTADEHYFGIDIALGITSLVGTPVRTEQVADRTFQVFRTADGERWISSGQGEVGYTITLTGSGSAQEWQQFTSALSADGAIAS